MKRITGIILAMFLMLELSAQDVAKRAPLNPDFVKFLEEKEAGGVKKTANGNGLGYIPSPLTINFGSKEESNAGKKSVQALPSKYDLRDYNWVSPVKDQGSVGACMSFSTIGAVESVWMKLGYATPDLSEHNLATCHGFEWTINDGGNFSMAAAYLTRLSGPVTEASDPYNQYIASCKTTGLVIPAYSPLTSWLPNDINIIKKAVLDYGAVSAAIYTGGNYMNLYYNTSDYTFYYNGTTVPDHAVLIVGWDDNKVVTGGKNSPSGSVGAWIVKNSWGTNWGDDGYFYVSYEDSRFLSSAAIYPVREDLSEIDTLYMFDRLGATSSYGYQEETGYGLVKFTSPQPNFIRKIGTFVLSSGSIVDIEIYDDFQGDSLLTNLIASSYNNIVKFPGYATFDVPVLVNGDYYVKIKYFSPDNLYPVPAETKISFQGEDYALPHIQPSGSYWISRTGEKWAEMGSDIQDGEADLCIRAYADRSTDLNAFFTSDRQEVCTGSAVTFKDGSNGNISDWQWNFGPGATPATATGQGPHNVTYSSTGKKDVSLTVTGSAGPKLLTRKSYIEVVDNLDIFLPYAEKLLVNGKSITITAFGAEDYVWSPATALDTTAGSTVIASPSDTITYTVNGTMGSCTGSAQITLNVVENPPNDDICDATEITTIGKVGEFTNIYATVQQKEPAPPEGDCNTDMEWCVEGGLQNSVWFWFTGPESGVVSIDTKGMDTQIAVYRLDDCDSIFSPTGFTMVAANDDYHSAVAKYAAAIESLDVTPGAKYYIQVDGSAGGVEGNFTLYFYDYTLGTKDMIAAPNVLTVYPNPNNGSFEMRLGNEEPGNVQVRVFDAMGKLVWNGQYYHSGEVSHNLDLGQQAPGVYYLEVITGKGVYHENLILK
jgi:C1A family cysteine protease/PKD repeat protein